MKTTVIKTTCDICKREIGTHDGLSQFVTERLKIIEIEKHSLDVELADICQRCSDSIMGEIHALADLA
jgi:hypothetical protein